MTMPSYSPFFETVYDEQSPVGNLGRGTHYSILRSVQWKSPSHKPLETPTLHTFALVWDEDHDKRIMNILEVAYMANLMPAVKFVGERKGGVTVIFDRNLKILNQPALQNLFKEWHGICQAGYANDVWNFEFGFDDNPAITAIINDKKEKVNLYLANIANLWPLGHSNFSPVNHLEKQKPILPPPFLANEGKQLINTLSNKN